MSKLNTCSEVIFLIKKYYKYKYPFLRKIISNNINNKNLLLLECFKIKKEEYIYNIREIALFLIYVRLIVITNTETTKEDFL